MLAIPGIDLHDQRCVWLAGAGADGEARRSEDPLHVARRCVADGFSRLHLVDVDATAGRGDNREIILELLRHASAPIQVGGGVCGPERAAALLDDGADWIVVETADVEDPAWLEEQAFAAPDRLILAVEVRGRRLVTRGWVRDGRRDLLDLLSELRSLPLGGLLVRAVPGGGRIQAAELALFQDVAGATAWPIIANGGVGSLQDLRNLESRGVAAAVLGIALFNETLDPKGVAEEFAD